MGTLDVQEKDDACWGNQQGMGFFRARGLLAREGARGRHLRS